MPVILAPDDYPAWLGEDAARDVAELLRPYLSEEMRAYRVSTAVNSVMNDGPECIEPTTWPPSPRSGAQPSCSSTSTGPT